MKKFSLGHNKDYEPALLMFPDETKLFGEKGVCGKQQNLEWRRVQRNENSRGVYTIGFEGLRVLRCDDKFMSTKKTLAFKLIIIYT